jgi:hypothetical protein
MAVGERMRQPAEPALARQSKASAPLAYRQQKSGRVLRRARSYCKPLNITMAAS